MAWASVRTVADTRGGAEGGMVCPECGEPAFAEPAADLVPWHTHGMEVPGWSHADGSSLCPAVAAGGYRPAVAVPAHAGPGGPEPSYEQVVFLQGGRRRRRGARRRGRRPPRPGGRGPRRRAPRLTNTCPTHGTYTGLICTRCVTTLPAR